MTLAKRIDEMAEDIEKQLIEKVKKSSCFAIELDESTDVTNMDILLGCVRFKDSVEDMMFCLELPQQITSAEIFKVLNDYIIANNFDWNKCGDICTDGADVCFSAMGTSRAYDNAYVIQACDGRD